MVHTPGRPSIDGYDFSTHHPCVGEHSRERSWGGLQVISRGAVTTVTEVGMLEGRNVLGGFRLCRVGRAHGFQFGCGKSVRSNSWR